MEMTKELALQRWKKLIADKRRVEKEMDEILRTEFRTSTVVA